MPQDRVDQLSVPLVLKQHADDLRVLKRYIGRWSYATPVAPATAPPGYTATDPLGVAFQPGVSNVPGQQPFRYRVHPASKAEVEGALDLGSSPSFPVLVCTLPGPGLGFWPTNPEPCQFPSYDQTAIWTGLIDTAGNVWATGVVAGPGTAALVNTGAEDTRVQPDTPTTVPFDGSPHAVAIIKAIPPDWLDTSGNIIVPGMYYISAGIRPGTAPTLPGLWGQWESPFNEQAQIPFPVDPLAVFGEFDYTSYTTLTAYDLPFSTSASYTVQTDATGTLEIHAYIGQMAAGG